MDSLNTSLHSQDHQYSSQSPLSRLGTMLREDKKDLYVLFVYTIVTGLLALAVPLGVQALVNTIAASLFTQPLVVLTLLVFGGLVLLGSVRLLQLRLVEILQQRIFVRVALTLANRIPRIKQAALDNEYVPELINRFFDVLTIQKTLAKLLLDGLAAVLQVCVGLVLMAFYSPFLLAFDFFLVIFVLFVVFVLGIGGLRTSINESVKKYSVAEWLEELGRCQSSCKIDGQISYFVQRADERISEYVRARDKHFRVIFRQAIGNYLFQAVASAGILALGGWLVINRQLTLGQLVAAELIVTSVLIALEKLIKQLEEVYDLLTGIDKIGHITDLPLERDGGQEILQSNKGASVVCHSVHFSYDQSVPLLTGLDLTLNPGERASLVGASGTGKSTLASLLCGIEEPSHGIVEINGIDVRNVNLESLRRIVAVVSDADEIINGTFEENIVLGRKNITYEHIQWALEITHLIKDLARFPKGLKTMLVSEGHNLSRGQIQRLLIARAIVEKPQLLILDEAFKGIDEKTKLLILEAIYSPENQWTIVDISHDSEVVARSEKIYVLKDGKIIETGTVKSLVQNSESVFADLFPYMTTTLSRLYIN